MNKTILILRILFLLLCVGGSWLLHYANPEWSLPLTLFMGTMVGTLTILVDIFLKGFSLRGMTALTFGLAVGALISYFISSSPLFEPLDADDEFAGMLYLTRLSLFVILMYLGAVIALRGRDEFNLVIPYMRFVPHGVDVPLAVVDTSVLIDGRIAHVCSSKWMGYALVIPRFVLEELQEIADSEEPSRQAKGRRGIEVLNKLRQMKHLDLRIHESEVARGEDVDAKLVFLAHSLKAKLLTLDYNLAKMAEFHGITWLNLSELAKALHPELTTGQQVEVELIKEGKEKGQAVGYLADGSMVVVNNARNRLGQIIRAEISSVIPSAGGKLIFAEIPDEGETGGNAHPPEAGRQ